MKELSKELRMIRDTYGYGERYYEALQVQLDRERPTKTARMPKLNHSKTYKEVRKTHGTK